MTEADHFKGKVALITGANRGIGLAMAQQLHAAGARVIATLRQERSSALDTIGVEQIGGVDVCDKAIKSALSAGLEAHGVEQIDLLINNAGLLIRDQLGSVDYEGFLKQLEVNTLGPLRVTEALLPYLTEGSRVAHITSRMGSIEDNGSGGYYGYRASKAALNAAAKSLAIDLAPKGISVAVLHPGFVQTDMTGGQGLITSDQSARGLIARMSEMSLQTSGSFWHMDGSRLPW